MGLNILDNYGRDTGLAVTGRVGDTGQNVLLCFFETGSSNRIASYCQIFFLIAFLDEAFIRNIIILLCIEYTK